MILYNRSDVVILERFHSNGRVEAGYYAQGFRLLDAVYMFGMIFAGLLYPMFSRLLKESKKEVVALLKTAGNLLIGGAIVLVIISTFNARWLLSLLYVNVQTTAVFSFCFLIICFIPISMNFIFGTLLTASGRLKTLNIISLFGVLINFTSNALLIPSIGAKGAAISALITQCFVAGIQFYYAYQSIQLNITPKALLNYVYLVSILLLSGFFSMYFGLDHGLAALMQLLLGGLLLFIFSFINLKNIKNILIIKEETNNYPTN
jgi:O-antigen/teichoic acid export membrane protein